MLWRCPARPPAVRYAAHRLAAYRGLMFVVELRFTDLSDKAPRLALRPRHRELLTALHDAGEVLEAGPFADGSGSMVVFTTTRERVDEALAADPYFAAEGVEVASIRELTPLFGPTPTPMPSDPH